MPTSSTKEKQSGASLQNHTPTAWFELGTSSFSSPSRVVHLDAMSYSGFSEISRAKHSSNNYYPACRMWTKLAPSYLKHQVSYPVSSNTSSISLHALSTQHHHRQEYFSLTLLEYFKPSCAPISTDETRDVSSSQINIRNTCCVRAPPVQ